MRLCSPCFIGQKVGSLAYNHVYTHENHELPYHLTGTVFLRTTYNFNANKFIMVYEDPPPRTYRCSVEVTLFI